jgi:hypothetical protein
MGPGLGKVKPGAVALTTARALEHAIFTETEMPKIVRQAGSHLRLSATPPTGSHSITIPDHDAIKIGTLNSIRAFPEWVIGKVRLPIINVSAEARSGVRGFPRRRKSDGLQVQAGSSHRGVDENTPGRPVNYPLPVPVFSRSIRAGSSFTRRFFSCVGSTRPFGPSFARRRCFTWV